MISKTIVSTEPYNSESCDLSPNSVNTVLGTVSCVFQSGRVCANEFWETLLLQVSTYGTPIKQKHTLLTVRL